MSLLLYWHTNKNISDPHSPSLSTLESWSTALGAAKLYVISRDSSKAISTKRIADILNQSWESLCYNWKSNFHGASFSSLSNARNNRLKENLGIIHLSLPSCRDNTTEPPSVTPTLINADYAFVLRLQWRRDGGTKIVTENVDLRFFKLNGVSLASLNLPNVG